MLLSVQSVCFVGVCERAVVQLCCAVWCCCVMVLSLFSFLFCARVFVGCVVLLCVAVRGAVLLLLYADVLSFKVLVLCVLL